MGVIDEEKFVGGLHDVIEDRNWSFERLTAEVLGYRLLMCFDDVCN